MAGESRTYMWLGVAVSAAAHGLLLWGPFVPSRDVVDTVLPSVPIEIVAMAAPISQVESADAEEVVEDQAVTDPVPVAEQTVEPETEPPAVESEEIEIIDEPVVVPEPEPVIESLDLEAEVELANVPDPAGVAAAGSEEGDLPPIPLRIRWESLENIANVSLAMSLVIVGARRADDGRPEVVAEFQFGLSVRVIEPRNSFRGFSNRVRSLPVHLFEKLRSGRWDFDEVWVLVPVAVDRAWSKALESALVEMGADRREKVRRADAEFVRKEGDVIELQIKKLVAR